jgi:hypothetical protein
MAGRACALPKAAPEAAAAKEAIELHEPVLSTSGDV